MKITTAKAVILYRILNQAKLGKMKDGDKFSIIKNVRELKPIALAHDDALRDASIKLRPEGFDPIEAKIANGEKLTLEEQSEVMKYDSAIGKCMREFVEREHDLTLAPVCEDSLRELVSANDFSVSEFMQLFDVLGQ